jgi:hypothetical protein
VTGRPLVLVVAAVELLDLLVISAAADGGGDEGGVMATVIAVAVVQAWSATRPERSDARMLTPRGGEGSTTGPSRASAGVLKEAQAGCRPRRCSSEEPGRLGDPALA